MYTKAQVIRLFEMVERSNCNEMALVQTCLDMESLEVATRDIFVDDFLMVSRVQTIKKLMDRTGYGLIVCKYATDWAMCVLQDESVYKFVVDPATNSMYKVFRRMSPQGDISYEFKKIESHVKFVLE